MKLPILASIALHTVVLSLSIPYLDGQMAPFSSARSLLQSSTAAAKGSHTPATFVMIENRARTLGNELSGSGTRYFAVRDYDLRGLSPAQALQRLAPSAVDAGSAVRKLEILIDFQRPLRLEARPGQPIDIGTAVVQAGGYHRIEINANIFNAELTLVK